MRPVDDFTRPEVFLEEKSWPGLVACSQRPVLLIICEHTLQAHYHKEANTEGTHEIKVSLLKVIHIHIVQLLCMTIFIIAMVIVMNMQLKVTHMPPVPPGLHLSPRTSTTGVTRSEAKPRLGQLDGYEAGAWNDYGANAGVVIKNLILSTWARPF